MHKICVNAIISISISRYLYWRICIYIYIYQIICAVYKYIYTRVIISVCISVWIHKAPEVEANCSRCTYLLHMHGTCQEGRNFQSFCAARHETGSCPGSVAGTLGCHFQDILAAHGGTWRFIPLSKWVITPVISGLTLLIPFITGAINHLLSGMSHQVLGGRFFVWNMTKYD